MDRSSEYRQEVEYVYVSLILSSVNQPQGDAFDLDIADLLHAKTQNPLSNHLKQRQKDLGLKPKEGDTIETDVLQSLLRYLEELKQVRNYGLSTAGLDILEYQQKALKLQPVTAQLLNARLLPAADQSHLPNHRRSYEARLQKYKYALDKALKRDGASLKDETRQEMQRLQLILGIASEDILSIEEIRAAQEKQDYAKLLNLLTLVPVSTLGYSIAPPPKPHSERPGSDCSPQTAKADSPRKS